MRFVKFSYPGPDWDGLDDLKDQMENFIDRLSEEYEKRKKNYDEKKIQDWLKEIYALFQPRFLDHNLTYNDIESKIRITEGENPPIYFHLLTEKDLGIIPSDKMVQFMDAYGDYLLFYWHVTEVKKLILGNSYYQSFDGIYQLRQDLNLKIEEINYDNGYDVFRYAFYLLNGYSFMEGEMI